MVQVDNVLLWTPVCPTLRLRLKTLQMKLKAVEGFCFSLWLPATSHPCSAFDVYLCRVSHSILTMNMHANTHTPFMGWIGPSSKFLIESLPHSTLECDYLEMRAFKLRWLHSNEAVRVALNPIWLVSLYKGEETPGVCVHRRRRRRWLSASWRERPRKEQTSLTPWSRLLSSRTMRKCMSVV